MTSPAAQTLSSARIVFLTRDPVVHEQSGSTSYIAGLLGLLRAQGADVTLVATTAYSRSPRLFFRAVAETPPGVALRFPGYLHVGGYYLAPFRPKAWARMVSRLALRRRWLAPLRSFVEQIYGPGLYTGAWDLTPPTPAECEAAVREVSAAGATAVVANYCVWGPLLGDRRLGSRRTAILMHDLLSARVQRFVGSGTPLDMPPITEAEEMQWLSGAETVFAAQEGEAEFVRRRVSSTVLVTPILLSPRALDPVAVVAGRCLFVGSNIPPNRTALEFLLEAVWPRVRAAAPGARLAIAGTVGRVLSEGSAPRDIASLGIEVLGVVPSLEAEYARAAVCVVPLRLGTGIKIKLLEALSFGKAIVSTSVGVEGLERWAAGAVEIADEAETFAAAMTRVLLDDEVRRQRECAALRLAEEQFGANRELDPAFAEALR
ncbi:MAG TPA: glycosyltransferase family 4 protein [Acidobacteriaceae bacterium]|nr:glycosyltransferase family 4 protein [Acidobacteriaceae bacterium]